MFIFRSDSDRQSLRQAQGACRGKAGYVPVTVLLMLDRGRAVNGIVEYFGLNDTTVYTDYRTIADWLATTTGVRYTVSVLTDLLHQLGYSYKLTAAMPCEAEVARQMAFFADTLLVPLLTQPETEAAVVYFANAVYPTHTPPAIHLWMQTYYQRPLLMVSGRERVNMNAALDAQSTQHLYQKLLAAYPEGPLYVVFNNVFYYKNQALNAWLVNNHPVQVFIPSYSLNLHLIERPGSSCSRKSSTPPSAAPKVNSKRPCSTSLTGSPSLAKNPRPACAGNSTF